MAAICDSFDRDTLNPFQKATYRSTGIENSVTDGKIFLPLKYNQPGKNKRLSKPHSLD
jgi:hypothetical protein